MRDLCLKLIVYFLATESIWQRTTLIAFGVLVIGLVGRSASQFQID